MNSIKYSLAIILSFLLSYVSVGQHRIAERINSHIAQQGEFQMIKDIFHPSKHKIAVKHEKFFKTDEDIQFLQYNYQEVPSHFSLELAYRDGNIIVDLMEVDNSFGTYKVSTSDNVVGKRSSLKLKHYRGAIRGEQESLVALTFSKHGVEGVISSPKKGNMNLGRIDDSGTHALFPETSFKKDLLKYSCEQIEGFSNPGNINSGINRSSEAPDPCRKVYMYFEADYEMFNHFNADEAETEAFVVTLFNQVSALYDDEGIDLELSEIFIHTSPDPYPSMLNTGVTSGQILTSFRTSGPSNFNGDLAHLLSFVDFFPNSQGIAYRNGICTGSFNRAVSIMFPGSNNYPTYSRQVLIVAHEIGHNLGSEHTHNCAWNGDNTTIDDYGHFGFDISGDLIFDPDNASGQSCINSIDQENPKLDVTPTIMSYADTRGHVDEFPLSNGFGQQPGDLIRDNIENASCLDAASRFHFEDEKRNTTDVFYIGEEVFIDGSASRGENQYNIGVWHRSLNDPNGDFNWFGGSGWISGEVPEHLNLSALILSGDLEFCPNFEYKVTLAISNIPCGVNWTPSTEYFTYLGEEGVNYEGVSAFHFENAAGEVQSSFCAGEPIYLNGEASENEDSYNITIYRRPIGSDDDYQWFYSMGWIEDEAARIYFSLILSWAHGITLDPGYEYQIQFAIANNPCVPWTVSYESFLLYDFDPPENLQINCEAEALTWNEVAGAEGYVVEFFYNGGAICCDSGDIWQQVASIPTSTNHLDIGAINFNWQCGNWKVRAICAGGGQSDWSPIECLYHCPSNGGGEEYSIKDHMDGFHLTTYPNPSQGAFTINIYSTYDSELKLSIMDLSGRLVAQSDDILVAKKNTDIKFNLDNHLPLGTYILSIQSDRETQYEKIIIQ